MSLTVYNMPDGQIFNSRKEICEHYGIEFEGPDDTERNVQNIILATKLVIKKRCWAPDKIHDNSMTEADILMVKIAYELPLTEEERAVWNGYKLFMEGRDPETIKE